MVYRSRHLNSLKPYVAGKSISAVARELGLKKIVKLASNENPLGVSPLAIEAIRQTAESNHRYPDPGSPELTNRLASHLELSPDRIFLGAGIDSILGYIINAFSDPGDAVLTSQGTFIGIYVHTQKLGRRLETVALKDYRFDLPKMLEKLTPDTRIIYLANPNNPTGAIFTADELNRFMTRVPSDVIVILDEAYFSYASIDPNYPNGLTLGYDNLIVTRTFSKDYGLAGLRIGYAVATKEVVQILFKARLPFEPSFPAQQGALAALDDTAFLDRSLRQNARSLDQFRTLLDRLGIEHLPTHANFLLMVFESEQCAVGLTDECLNRGLILRHTGAFGLANCVRMNSGTDDETEFALRVIEEAFAEVSRCPAPAVLG